jgi:hypothetical protein
MARLAKGTSALRLTLDVATMADTDFDRVHDLVPGLYQNAAIRDAITPRPSRPHPRNRAP